MKLTKRLVESFSSPDNQQIFIRDDELKGFALRVTPLGAKSFIIEKRIKGVVKRITLGKYPEITVEQARREAQKLLGKIAIGIDPLAEKKELERSHITVLEVFNEYLKTRKNLKATTVLDYQRVMQVAFSDWKNKALSSISKEMVAKRHAKLGKASHARANLAMRVLRALFNFAINQYEKEDGKPIFTYNPVNKLSHTKAWYRVDRRQTLIKLHELPKWYAAVATLEGAHAGLRVNTVRDYLLFMLFTGLRREEGARLQCKHVDLHGKTITIPDTKNNQPHVLPLSDYLHPLLNRCFQHKINEYVFPGSGKVGYIIEPRKTMTKITELTGIEFTLHDLRRTFITIAESLDIPVYALKHLLNHKMKSDVTASYIVMDVERLREPMQKITNYILSLVSEKHRNVLLLPSKRQIKEGVINE